MPDEAGVWRADLPDWTRKDEWGARVIEATEHWGRLLVLVMAGQKIKLGPPERIFEHPDRPDPEASKKEITTDATEIQQFFARMSGRR